MHWDQTVSLIHSMCTFATAMLMVLVQWNSGNVRGMLLKNNQRSQKQRQKKDYNIIVLVVLFDDVQFN